MNENALIGFGSRLTQIPHESLREARVMVVAAGLAEVGPVETALRAAGAITERVHPRDKWRWLFFEQRPQLLIVFVTEDPDAGGLTRDELMQAGLTAHAPVLALALGNSMEPVRGASSSLPASAGPSVVAAEAAQLLAPHVHAISLRAGSVALDADRTRVWVAGRPVIVTPTEYALLAYMMTHRSRVLAYERILADVWPRGDAPSVRGLAVHLTRLRTKLAGAPDVRLTSMRGVGYCFDLATSV